MDDLPEHIKSACGIGREEEEEKVCRMDMLWGFLKGYRASGTTELMFNQPFKVVEVVLIAGKESIFLIFSRHITVKTHKKNPLEWKPTDS